MNILRVQFASIFCIIVYYCVGKKLELVDSRFLLVSFVSTKVEVDIILGLLLLSRCW
jgi:hypothetical protein